MDERDPGEITELDEPEDPVERTYDGYRVVLVMLGIFVLMLLLSAWMSSAAMGMR